MNSFQAGINGIKYTVRLWLCHHYTEIMKTAICGNSETFNFLNKFEFGLE